MAVAIFNNGFGLPAWENTLPEEGKCVARRDRCESEASTGNQEPKVLISITF